MKTKSLSVTGRAALSVLFLMTGVVLVVLAVNVSVLHNGSSGAVYAQAP